MQPSTVVRALALLYHWPTVVLLARAAWQWRAISALDALAFEVLLRLARLLAVAAHEGAHAAAAAWWMPQPSPPKLVLPTGAGLAGSLARQLLPGAYAPSVCIELPSAKSATEADVGAVRAAGAAASLLLAACAVAAEVAAGGAGAVAGGAVSAAAGAVLSDLPGGPLLGCLPPLGCFCCGNWGLLAPRAALSDGSRAACRGILPRICEQILSGVLEVVELRGAQAGGVCTFVSDGGGSVDALRSRTVKPKRGHLATKLFKDFRWEIVRRMVRGLLIRPRSLPVVLMQGHSRFGTSSSPEVNETHPHQWLGSQREVVWLYDTSSGRWRRELATVCITVTHNGDFDAFEIYGQSVPNATLGMWLSRVLHHQNTAKGDSPKFAGLMDLMVCQGRWFASTRYAFVKVCMQHIDQASGWEKMSPEAPNAMPAKAFFREVAGFFDAAFADIVAVSPGMLPEIEDIDHLAQSVTASLATSLSPGALDVLVEFEVGNELLSAFSLEACRYFFQQDLLTCIHSFFKHAEGTFGVSASCTLWPSSIVLAAKGQPVSLAFDMERPIAVWSSEPSSLMVRWPAAQAGRPRRLATARWDLQDAAGEAVELRVCEGGTAAGHVAAAARGLPGGLPEARVFATPDAKAERERAFHILVRGTSLDREPRALTAEAFANRWVRLRAPPFRTARGRSDGPRLDPVAADLQDVPATLADIDSSWSDRASLNYLSGLRFAGCLRGLLEAKRDDNVDVLVFGVENSLWVGQQFAADLKRIFPKLNVMAISSNWILGMLQQSHGNIEPRNFTIAPQDFRLAPGAIALALSHSGTTYPTVWAARLVTRRFPGAHGFAMSSDFDTVLANSIGQDSTSTFTGALFSTFAGIRPAEPATVATIAMHHTLTCLLVACARGAAKKSGREWGLERKRGDGECELDVDEVADLQRLAATLLPASEQICGVSKYRRPIPNMTREQLLHIGGYVSSHLTEGWYSTFWMCVYIYITVTCHVPLFSLAWSLVTEYTALELDDTSARVIDYAVSCIDAHLYVFFAVLVMLLHRMICGRRLWTRFAGRTVVVVDSTVNYKLLRAFGSKLGALAFPFTAFRVTGQNGEDHFVHEMTHLATSDVILLVGRPDGRLGTLAATEGATLMSTQQARYICSRPSRGIEAISIGHNPFVKPGLFRKAVALPSVARPTFLSQQLLGTQAGPHAPGDVLAAAAALVASGSDATAAFEPFAWVTKEVLRQELAKLNVVKERVSRDDALAVVTSLVKANAQALDIDHEAFDASEVTTRAAVSRSPSFIDSLSRVAAGAGSRNTVLSAMAAGLRSKSIAAQNDMSLSNILAILRGRRMHAHLRKLQLGRKSAVVMEHVQARDTMIDAMQGVRRCFAAWAKHTLRMLAESQARHTSSKGSEAPNAEWRVQEEFRRRRRQHFMELKAIGLEGAVFGAWHGLLKDKDNILTPLKEYLTGTPPKVYDVEAAGADEAERDALPIGGRLAGQAEGGRELLEGLRALERLYETRIGAAERLLASYVVLHRAAQPVSRLRFLSYDLDRSESRLRVASTPAPVPFVEELPPSGVDAGALGPACCAAVSP